MRKIFATVALMLVTSATSLVRGGEREPSRMTESQYQQFLKKVGADLNDGKKLLKSHNLASLPGLPYTIGKDLEVLSSATSQTLNNASGAVARFSDRPTLSRSVFILINMEHLNYNMSLLAAHLVMLGVDPELQKKGFGMADDVKNYGEKIRSHTQALENQV